MLMHIAPLLALTPEIKQELYPILLFLGMFAVVFGLGGTLVRRLPRKLAGSLDGGLRAKACHARLELGHHVERLIEAEQHTQEKE